MKDERKLPRMWSTEDLAAHWSLRPATVRAWARAGRLPGVRLGNLWRFRESDLVEFLEKTKATDGAQP